MNTYIDSRLINISSDSADEIQNGSSLSSCIFYFQGMLKNEEDIVYSQISIMNAQIPMSYYIINEYNNILKYKIGNGSIQTAYFEYGNYNATTFITEFKAKLGGSFNITLNKLNGKYSITNNNNFTILSSGSTVLKVIGFDANTNYTSTSSTLNAPYPCNFAGITRIKITSDVLQTYSMDSITGGFSNNLQTLSVNSGSYGILLFENTQRFRATLRNKWVDYFDINFLDDNDNYIDFNNIDWHMTLQLDIIRKVPETNTYSNMFNPQQIPTDEEYVDEEQPQGDEQQVEEQTNEYAPTEQPVTGEIQPYQEEEQMNDEPLKESTGDTDLDFLLYTNNIYQ